MEYVACWQPIPQQGASMKSASTRHTLPSQIVCLTSVLHLIINLHLLRPLTCPAWDILPNAHSAPGEGEVYLGNTPVCGRYLQVVCICCDHLEDCSAAGRVDGCIVVEDELNVAGQLLCDSRRLRHKRPGLVPAFCNP